MSKNILIPLGLAYVTRRMAIGGWLFLYYLSLLASIALVSILIIPSLPVFLDEGWSPLYWWIAFFDLVPWLVATALTWCFGLLLLFKHFRNARNLKLMRYSLLAVFTFSLLRVLLAVNYPDPDSPMVVLIMGLVSSAVWSLYWWMSKRVKCVMTRAIEPWDYKAFKG